MSKLRIIDKLLDQMLQEDELVRKGKEGTPYWVSKFNPNRGQVRVKGKTHDKKDEPENGKDKDEPQADKDRDASADDKTNATLDRTDYTNDHPSPDSRKGIRQRADKGRRQLGTPENQARAKAIDKKYRDCHSNTSEPNHPCADIGPKTDDEALGNNPDAERGIATWMAKVGQANNDYRIALGNMAKEIKKHWDEKGIEYTEEDLKNVTAATLKKEGIVMPPTFNLCAVTVPGTNLYCGKNKGVPRQCMPQLKSQPDPEKKSSVAWKRAEAEAKKDHEENPESSTKPENQEINFEDDFLTYLENTKNVKVRRDETMPSHFMKASQAELDNEKVAGMAWNLYTDPKHEKKSTQPLLEPLIVSKDGYVLDGHHRWAAHATADIMRGGKHPTDVSVVMVDMGIEELIVKSNEFADKMGLVRRKAHGSGEIDCEKAMDKLKKRYSESVMRPKLEEDGAMPAPTMSAGSGQIAGIGVGAQGEPGVDLAAHKKKKRPAQEKSLSDIAMEIAQKRDLTTEDLRDWFGKGKEGGVGGGGWDRYNTKGERIGKCGDADARGGKGEGKPKCLSKEKAAQLRAKGGKKEIANAVRRKKQQDPVTDRKGTGSAPRPVSNRIGEETTPIKEASGAPISPAYAQIILKAGQKFFIKMVSNTEKFISGYEVTKDADEIQPRSGGKQYDRRLRVIQKTEIARLIPMKMDRHYAILVKENTPDDHELNELFTELNVMHEAWKKITTCQQCKSNLSSRERKLGFRICDKCVAGNKNKIWGKDSDDDYVDENCNNLITQEEHVPLIEGVDDPGVLKCVFMAGGPGSGKSYVAGELFAVTPRFRASFSTYGLKLVNSDVAFEKALHQNGIDPKNLATLIHDTDKWSQIMSLRDRAKALTNLQQRHYESGRLGLIIDGTGDDANKIRAKVQHAQSLGYDCYMVFVNTSLETALARNARRPRSLPESVVKDLWAEVQKNVGTFQQLFGPARFLIVDNNKESQSLDLINKQIRSWMNAPIANPIGKKWHELAHRLRRSKIDTSRAAMSEDLLEAAKPFTQGDHVVLLAVPSKTGQGDGRGYWKVGKNVFRAPIKNVLFDINGEPMDKRWESTFGHFNRYFDSTFGQHYKKAPTWKATLKEEDCGCDHEPVAEASKYQGRKVTLGKPFRTPDGPRKFSVYVRNDKGNVVKVNFGDPNMEIKRDDPARRKNFRARHNCDNPGPRWKARYWSCRWGWGRKALGK